MNESFSADYAPPAPCLTVFIGRPGEKPAFGPFEAILDTGADISIAPRKLFARMGIDSSWEAAVRGLWGKSQLLQMYLTELQIGDILLPNIFIAGSDNENDTEDFILGRNVLNKLPLFLDGPKERTYLLNDASVNRLRATRVSAAVKSRK